MNSGLSDRSVASGAVQAARPERTIDAETFSALVCARFAINCLRDGLDIGEKLPDALARIDALLGRTIAA